MENEDEEKEEERQSVLISASSVVHLTCSYRMVGFIISNHAGCLIGPQQPASAGPSQKNFAACDFSTL